MIVMFQPITTNVARVDVPLQNPAAGSHNLRVLSQSSIAS
jgi:hypothetical protein